MDAFNQADLMVSACSGVFGVIAVIAIIFFAMKRKKKA